MISNNPVYCFDRTGHHRTGFMRGSEMRFAFAVNHPQRTLFWSGSQWGDRPMKRIISKETLSRPAYLRDLRLFGG